MQNLNPAIAQSLRPFMGSMGMFTNNPAADAARHFDRLAGTRMVDVDFDGLALTLEVDDLGDVIDAIGAHGEEWYDRLSSGGLRELAKRVAKQDAERGAM